MTIRMLRMCWIVFFIIFTQLSEYSIAEYLSNGQDVDTFIEKRIAGADVVVFAKSYCPYCKHTTALLTQLHQDARQAWKLDILNLDQIGEDGPRIQMELLLKTQQRTVPNIFIYGKHVGGDSDLTALHHSGKLQEMLDGISSIS